MPIFKEIFEKLAEIQQFSYSGRGVNYFPEQDY